MPVEIEVPTEHLHETIHEEHHKSSGHGEAHGHGGGFTLGVALSSAILAVLAALAALFAGHYANDAMIERIEAGDQWAYYQAKGIKLNMLESKIATLTALGHQASPKDEKKVEEYGREKKEIQEKASEYTEESEAHLTQHTRLAGSVTFFQVAIALGAIAVLTRKKLLWFGSLAVGVCGVAAMAYGFMPPNRAESAAAAEHKSEGGELGAPAEAKAHDGAKPEAEAKAEPAKPEAPKPEKPEASAAETKPEH